MTSPPQYPPPPDPSQNFTGMPQYAAGPGPTPGKGLSVAGLVCGIVSVPFALIPVVGIILGVLGIVFGAIGLSRSKRRGAPGKGMAIAGLVLGVIGLIIGIVIVIVGVKNYQDCRDSIGHNPSQSELRQCIRDGV